MPPESRFNQWDQHPRLLTNAEIANPIQVIHDVFDYAHLPDLRNGLWEWLKTTVSGNFNKGSLHYKDKESLLALYERMIKLVEAAHLLLAAKNLTDSKLPPQKDNIVLSSFWKTALTTATETKPIVERLVGLISPDFVFDLGKVEGEEAVPVYYFIVVLPANISYTYAGCQALVETACTNSGTVQLFPIKTVDLVKHLQEGHLLYSRICTEPYLLYQQEGVSLPKPDFSKLPELTKAAENMLEKVLYKAQAFYEGAIFYLQQKNYSLSVFMLQQAVEHALRGFLQAITRRNHITHDLILLRRQALPIYPELTQILPVEKDKANCLLYGFGKAYVQARYQPDFEMSVTEISQLKEWVGELLTYTKPAFLCHIQTLYRFM